MSKCIVLLNGPPSAGKSTTAAYLQHVLGVADVIGFSYHLKRMVHGVYLGRRGWDLDPDHFNSVKELPQDILDGKSWRQMYIHYSENVIKPLHGKRWFGDMFVKAARASALPAVAVPDSGFVSEAEPVVEAFGAPNVLLVRLHRTGYDYSKDSRTYINLDHMNVRTLDIKNVEKQPDDMLATVAHHVAQLRNRVA